MCSCCSLPGPPMHAEVTLSHAKPQLHLLPNFLICPSKIPLFLDFANQIPFPAT